MARIAERPVVKLVVTDLDNTLWNWFEPWYAGFSALIDGVAGETGVARDTLLDEAKALHQENQTTEYSWLLDEMPSLAPWTQGRNPRHVFRDAFHAQNSSRLRSLSLYPGTREALETLATYRVPTVAYTESRSYWTRWRMKKLDLDGVVDRLYSSDDHGTPDTVDVRGVRLDPEVDFRLTVTEHRHVQAGLVKPNPLILSEIADDYGCLPSEIAYVGDSLDKDVKMAQDFGAIDVHAAYGVVHNDPRYDLLRRVSHWTDEQIESERANSSASKPTPTYSLDRSIADMLELFDFGGAHV